MPRPSLWLVLSLCSACGGSGGNDADSSSASGSGGASTSAGAPSTAGAGTGGDGGGDDGACAEVVDTTPSPDPGTFAERGERVGLTQAIDNDRSYANGTERLYLSGSSTDDALDWKFMVTSGARACEWTTLPVPSQWEFHGFGAFRYGSETRTTEQGLYRRSFEVPADWSNKQVFVVFEGAMTDTRVSINGKSAGPVHQGAFYRFKYDVSELLKLGAANELEVTVAKESADASVNEAERQADYWVFGGIFRPVYLEAFPRASIERLAIDAEADGTLRVDTFLRGVEAAAELVGQIYDEDMTPVGEAFTAMVEPGTSKITLASTIEDAKSWSAETPHRYRLAVDLLTAEGVVHAARENFGFRTLEVRAGDGIYVNGTKVMLRGVNRHSFWPESGRALSPRLSWSDALLLKSMNVNAVRSAHYPSDEHFYDYADALGLYVLDELAGWQSPPYEEVVGQKLVEELVTFNVNHPSILFWNNGNEGGWNPLLDPEFRRWDPQERPVLHPWATFSNVNTDHYESYTSTVAILGRDTIFLPTEFLHGLYDGGGGAGLEDYWNAMRASPLGAGGFLWAFVDEGVLRQNGQIDVKGNAAPDGVVGPYREKEGSFYTIRQLWSPVQIAMQRLPDDFAGSIQVENHYDFTDLNTLQFAWKLVRFDVRAEEAGHAVLTSGAAVTQSIAPRAAGVLELELPADFREADALLLAAVDATGTLVGQWSWMTRTASELRQSIVSPEAASARVAGEDELSFTIAEGDAEYTFSKETGQLAGVTVGGNPFSLTNGPALSAGTATLESLETTEELGEYVVTATYSGDLEQVRWRVMGEGWLALSYRYTLSGSYDFFGVDFDYPVANVQGVQWLGRGPHRVWKNRMQGPWHDVWAREANTTTTGQSWEYPEFRGYFADLHWARLQTSEGPILFVADSPDLFLRLYTAANGFNAQGAAMVFPENDISFLHGIPGIGDKFLPAASLGPQGQKHELDGDTFEATLYLRFGEL